MPRKTIKLPHRVEHLSVLDSEGNLDSKLEPDLPEETLLRLHRIMLLSRRFDERLLSLQRQGKIGTFAPVKGQEASQLGVVAALEKDDWMVPSFRETAAALWRGTPMWGLLLYNAGYNEGGEIPEKQHDLPICIPVASQIPHAAGIAYAIKYRRKNQIALTFFGDGATSEGDFHEALNFAGVYECPVVFVCQNNQYAISVPREQQTASKTLAQKALAYGIPGIQVDGNDLLGVYVAAQEAVDRARSGKGPTMIECVTYRLEVHTTADDPSKYRDEAEWKEWAKRDPLPRFQRYLIEKEYLSDATIENLEKKIKKETDDAWKTTAKKIEDLHDPLVMFDHVYAEMPAYLQEQKESFQQILKNSGGSSHA